jgi:hypothetical protein
MNACGATPAKYSALGIPSVLNANSDFISIIAAHGVERAGSYHQTRSNMKTVAADYYAEGVE